MHQEKLGMEFLAVTLVSVNFHYPKVGSGGARFHMVTFDQVLSLNQNLKFDTNYMP